MTIATAFPSGSNTFVPSFDASGKLQIEFSRNPKKFKVNRYVKIRPVKKDVGYYLNITAAEAARVINSSGNDFVWADGNEAPMGDDNNESFTYLKYATLRYAFPFTIGNKAVEQADWDIIASHARIAAQKSMTFRTIKTLGVLNTSGNWMGNTDTATNVAGGKLDVASTTTLYIKKAFRGVAEAILKSTLGVVNREDINCVLGPHDAGLISEAPELVQHLIQSPFALAQVRQDVANQNGQWGLPDVLYGINIIVEDAVKITTKKTSGDNTKTADYCMPAATLMFLSRPEGLMGSEGVPDFSTVQIFSYEDMTVETKKDPDNRREQGRIVDDFDVQVVAPASGYLLTACTG